MAKKSASQTKQGQQSRSSSVQNASLTSVGLAWRSANLLVAAFFALRAVTHINTDPDWWLWAPIYLAGVVMCGVLAVCGKCAESSLWRYLCSCVIVVGTSYLLFTAWILRETAAAYLPPADANLMEGRECTYISLLIFWAVFCRVKTSTKTGVMRVVRLLLLTVLLVVSAGVLLWSLCFHETVAGLPFVQPLCRQHVFKYAAY